MEIAKTHELTAEYRHADHKVLLRLWHRGDPDREGQQPIDEASLTPGGGYAVNLRITRRAMLERNGLREHAVLGA